LRPLPPLFPFRLACPYSFLAMETQPKPAVAPAAAATVPAGAGAVNVAAPPAAAGAATAVKTEPTLAAAGGGAAPSPAVPAPATAATAAAAKPKPALWAAERVLDAVRLARAIEAEPSAPEAAVSGGDDEAPEAGKAGEEEEEGKDPAERKSFDYEPGKVIAALPVLSEKPPLCTVTVPGEFLSTSNPAFQGCRVWGTDLYAPNSDVVCMLAHLGYLDIGQEAPTNVESIVVTLRVVRPAIAYSPSTRCGLRSRHRNGNSETTPYSLMVESATMKLNGDIADQEMYPTSHVFQQPLRVNRPRQQGSARFCLPGLTVVFDMSMDPCLKYSLPMVMDMYEAVEPDEDEEEPGKTKAKPTKSKSKAAKKSKADDKAYSGGAADAAAGGAAPMDTDAASPPAGGKEGGEGSAQSGGGSGAEAASGASDDAAQGGGAAEAKLEPPPRIIIDTSRLTSTRLQKECIYMETATQRYELSQQLATDKQSLLYRVSRVNCPQLLDQAAMHSQERPLQASLVEVIYEDLQWREVEWAPNGVTIKDLELKLSCLRFVARSSPASSLETTVFSSFSTSAARGRATEQKAAEEKERQEKDEDEDEEEGEKARRGRPKGKGKGKGGKASKSKAAAAAGAEGEAGAEGADVAVAADEEASAAAEEGGAAMDEAAAPAERASRRSKGKPAPAAEVRALFSQCVEGTGGRHDQPEGSRAPGTGELGHLGGGGG
jgi:hypothetical protein